MNDQTESHTRLSGKWLLIARLAWMAVFTVLTIMYALGFLEVREALSTVCDEEPCTLRQQIRHTEAGEQVMNWQGPAEGYPDPLRPDQVKVLETLGLTLDQYGWLGALQLGIPALVYLLIAVGLFWWKSNDWMVLFASTMVATVPFDDMPLPYILAVREPIWQWIHIPANFVAISSFFIFPLIFPNGQFVPRWTRWKALFDIAFAVILTLLRNSILREPPGGFLFAYIVLSFCINAYAQSYRYFRMASPVERQQIKWVVVGVVGFISIAFLMDTFLYYHPIIIDPARALVLSAIIDTLFRAISLFIPVSITISVMRYRLWDIDIIISRTLVYGALTASVVGLYVLIVGWSSIGLQTQNNLAGRVFAILVIAFLFRPLRQRLQHIADRFVPVPQSTSPLEEYEHKLTIPEGTTDSTLRGYRLLMARVVWVLIALLSISIFILGTVAQYERIREPCAALPLEDQPNCWPTENALHQLGLTWEELANFYTLIGTVAALPIILIGCVVFWRKSANVISLLFSLVLVIAGSAGVNQSLLDDLLRASPDLRILLASIHFLGNVAPLTLAFLFPDGRFVPRWTRWVFILWAGRILYYSTIRFVVPSLANTLWWKFFDLPVNISFFFVAVYAMTFRYRYDANAVQRQQIKWMVMATLVVSIILIAGNILGHFWQPGFSSLFLMMIYDPLWYLGALFVGICIGISIFRYRLWDIDIIINRTVVYGVLIVIVLGLYVLVVGVAGRLFQSVGNSFLAILATGLIAVLFHPLRQRLQRGVNHLMYGERDDPYAVLSRLGQRLEAAYAPESVLPTIVETVAQTLKLPYVAIALNQGGEFKIAAEFGRSKSEPINLPLIYQGEPVGELILAARAPGEHFTGSERQLLDDLARQAGVAAHAVRLTADLQRSRERLVSAREEERRRLRRDLHDGLGPQLASLALKLEAARNRMADDPQAAALLTELSTRTQDAVADIRRLVYALRPPALDELGLVIALREGAMQYNQQGINGLNITFDAPENLPSLPAAVEVAAYRITQEALTNVVRHAEARTCLVRLSPDESAGLLCLEVQDDGKGLPIERRAGVGLNSMRERAEELGGTLTITSLSTGGTSVLARLPCQVNQPSHRADRDASVLSQGAEV